MTRRSTLASGNVARSAYARMRRPRSPSGRPCRTPTEFATVFMGGAAAEEGNLRQRFGVDVEKASESHVVGPVAAADAEDVDVELLEVLCGAMKVVHRVDSAHDAVVAKGSREA